MHVAHSQEMVTMGCFVDPQATRRNSAAEIVPVGCHSTITQSAQDDMDHVRDAPVTTTTGSTTIAIQAMFNAVANDSFFQLVTECNSQPAASSSAMALSKTIDETNVRYLNEYVDKHGRTLLHQACRYGNLEIAKSLLFHGLSASSQCIMGRTPFHEAVFATAGALELLQLLFDYDPKGIAVVDLNGSHLLHLAAIHGRLDVIRWCATLVSSDTFSTTAPLISCDSLSRPRLSMAITSFSGRNMLHYAAHNGRLHILQWLLGGENECNTHFTLGALDVNGYSVLHYAVMGGHLEVCKWIVFHAPTRHSLNFHAQNSEGKRVFDVAADQEIRRFLFEVAQSPPAPCNLHCIGADNSSLGVCWSMKAFQNPLLSEVLAPKWFEIEFCKKPTGLTLANSLVSMLTKMPSSSNASSSTTSPYHMLKWKQVNVAIQPQAREYWISGLDKDTEYLIRIRAKNRNGYSDYSLPTKASEFTTMRGGSTTQRSRFIERLASIRPYIFEAAFIGNLHFELLEARRLAPFRSTKTIFSSRKEAAEQGRYYAVITLEVPMPGNISPAYRRKTVPLGCPGSSVECSLKYSKWLYNVRSDFSAIQDSIVLSGTLHALCHPVFNFYTTFRVPDTHRSMLTIQIHHETQHHDICVGTTSIPLLDLVRGLPAKMQWLPLGRNKATEKDESDSAILVRTLFLADGISALPHPSDPAVLCTTAAELLEASPTTMVPEKTDKPPTAMTVSHSLPMRPISSVDDGTFDELGFRIYDPQWTRHNHIWKHNPSRKPYLYYKLYYKCTENQQQQKWRRFLHHHSEVGMSDKAIPDPVLRQLVWLGIPSSQRPRAYLQMSGAMRRKKSYETTYFQSLIQQVKEFKMEHDQGTTSECTEQSTIKARRSRFNTARKQIEVDLQRTFASNMCWINTPEGQRSLERVLLVYAVHNESLGYCQSMTFIVGRLLCLFHAQEASLSKESIEEDVFWLLTVLCEDFFPNYYTKGMTGLQGDGLVLEALLQKRDPKVYRHFLQLQVPHLGLLLVTQWLLPVCCAGFPSETTFRLLDALFYEGYTVVFALVIALLRISRHDILNETKDYMQLFRCLKERDQRLYDSALLMEIAYDEHLVLADEIEGLRAHYIAQLNSEAPSN